MPEVVALGEAMLRLTPPNYRRLEQADCFEVEVGGAELNTAVGLVRLGRAVAWVSRLPDQPLGRLVLNRARAAGVDVSGVQLTPGGRVGLYFLEQGAAPRPGSIIYDRHDSAMAQLRPGQFDWPSLFASARWFHVTGITPALSPTAAEAVREALHAARSAGLTVSMDVNYRAKLWSLEQARRWLQEATHCVDVLITGEGGEQLLGVEPGPFEQTARQLCERFGLRAVAMTQREAPLVWRNRLSALAYAADGDRVFTTASYEIEVVDRLGAGDAFAAGLIDGLLANDPQRGLDQATALAALKHTVPGDLPWLDRADLDAAMQAARAGGGLRLNR
jgi:2-dehydro-3-deoxygluconokinase